MLYLLPEMIYKLRMTLSRQEVAFKAFHMFWILIPENFDKILWTYLLSETFSRGMIHLRCFTLIRAMWLEVRRFHDVYLICRYRYKWLHRQWGQVGVTQWEFTSLIWIFILLEDSMEIPSLTQHMVCKIKIKFICINLTQ